MSFVDAIRTCLRRFATFSGRASRPEFWWFVLALMLASSALSIVDAAIFGPHVSVEHVRNIDSSGRITDSTNQIVSYGGGPVSGVFSLLSMLPLLAASWRRMHDTGRPGWWTVGPPLIAVGLIFYLVVGLSGINPFTGTLPDDDAMRRMVAPGHMLQFFVVWLVAVVCFIAPIWWLSRPTQSGPNEYGPNPLEVTP